jgi:hypothetical protein
VLIRQDAQTYRFLAFEFRDRADGSFYLVFDRESLSTRFTGWGNDPNSPVEIDNLAERRFRISYHASGQINYHRSLASRIFADAIFAISGPQTLACISVPSVDRLTRAHSIRETDVVSVIEVPAGTGRLAFHLAIVPGGVEFEVPPLAVVSYEGWFALAVSLGPLPTSIPPKYEQHVLTYAPGTGKYSAQVVTQDEAVILFHQKRNQARGGMLLWEPKQGEYRFIFSVPTRVPPEFSVEFVDPKIKAEIVRTTKSELRFRARGPAGYLKSFQSIKLPLNGYAEL